MDLFVITHKQVNVDAYPERNIIFVGKKQEELLKKNEASNVFRDGSGDNIADKNWTYCETTAMYWIDHNISDSDYIGIEHYRRLFCDWKKRPRSQAYLLKQLETHDVVVKINWCYFFRNKDWFVWHHGKENYKAMRNAIAKLYPDYLPFFDRRMRSNIISYCNMMVAPKAIYHDYCKFLFDVLFETEKHISIPKTGHNSRMMGFMAERLLDVYLDKNKLKKKGSLVLMTDRGLI